MPEQSEMPTHYDDLKSVERAWKEMLAGAVSDRTHPFKKTILTTVGPSGAPKARTVILRDITLDDRSVRIHTDARSDKVSEIGRNPNVMLAFYDPSQEIQVQLSGKATVHESDAYADAAWAGAAPSSRRAYLAEIVPGTPLSAPASGLPSDVEGVIPSEERLEAGRSNFAAVQLVFDQVDWLFLSPRGNRRARFTFDGKNWAGTWLAP